MWKKEPTRDDIIQIFKEAAAEDKQTTKRLLNQKGINGYWVEKLVPEGLTELKRELGIRLDPREQPYSSDELLVKIDKVVSHLRKMPTWAQLRRETGITDKVFIKNLGNKGIQDIFSRYLEWLEEHQPESENIKLVNVYFEGQVKTKSPARLDVRRRHQPSANKILFVDLQRINELRSIKSDRFDLTKLIRLCEELNECYSNEYYLAVSMLARALLDHIPPVFDFHTFPALASQYSGGGKSFKECMQHLENSSRKIADAHLHGQIRNKETLPNKTQVNFSVVVRSK